MSPAPSQHRTLFDIAPFPRTRYQGSKRKLTQAILHELRKLVFTTVLDAFGGTAAVAHAFKCAGKHVTYNDRLTFNYLIGLALIENDNVRITEGDLASLGTRLPDVSYDDFIERTFEGIYFTNNENRWLDAAVANVGRIPCRFRRALAWFSIFQAAMAKRPYNLFHRRNLYMRTADVDRSFGNKASWDRPFPDHVAVFAAEANAALVDGHGTCRALCEDALDLTPEFDLVYIDTPYINRTGVGVDYRDFYHFLEGMTRYDEWPNMLDTASKHLRLRREPDPWSDAQRCDEMFQRLFDRFRRSILAVSYRSDGLPTVDRLTALLKNVKPHVRVADLTRNQYALSTRRESREVLLVATD